MNFVLETIVRKLSRAEQAFDGVLRRIRRPVVESWMLPATVFGALSAEALNLTRRLDIALISHQDTIREYIGGPGYRLVEQVAPFAALSSGIACVAVPAAVALHRYYSRKPSTTRIDYRNTVREYYTRAKKFLAENRFINNRVVLPALTALGLGYFSLESGLTNTDSPLKVVGGLLVAGLGLSAAKDLYDYFRKEVPATPPRTRITAKAPLAYALCATAVANFMVGGAKSNLVSDSATLQRVTALPEPSESPRRIIGYRTVNKRVMSYWDACDYYTRLYGENTDFVRALIIAESNFKHYRGRRALESIKGAIGLGQQTRINVRHLNQLIAKGKLVGEGFDWHRIVSDPAENIRATVATIRSLRENLCGDSQSDEECLEIIAGGYLAGQPTIRAALANAESNNVWDALGFIGRRARTDVAYYIRKVMSNYWTMRNDVVWPTRNRGINSGYGEVRNGGRIRRIHRGIDIAPRKTGVAGDPIVAIGDGVVVVADRSSSGPEGISVKVRHGGSRLGFHTSYFHGQPGSVVVRYGQRVRRGDLLMRMGTTGRSDGVHLHFGTSLEYDLGGRRQSTFLNPLDFYRDYGEDKLVVNVREPVYEKVQVSSYITPR